MSISKSFDELYNSIEDTTHSPTEAISAHKLILLNTPLSGFTDGEFLINHFLSSYLKSNYFVIFVTFKSSITHYQMIASKLGVNINQYLMKEPKTKSRLHFIDCFTINENIAKNSNFNIHNCTFMEGNSKPTLKYLKEKISSLLLQDEISKFERISILVDDFSIPVLFGLEVKHLISFTLDLRSSNQTLTVPASRIILHIPSPRTSLSFQIPLNLVIKYLTYESDIVFNVECLSTGISREVHGKLNIKGITNTPMDLVHPVFEELHFKIEERGVQFYPIGTASGII